MMKKYILCIGDSTTSQEWCHPNWTDWLNFVFRQGEQDTNYVVINNGVDGGTVNTYLDNFEEYIQRYTPGIVIISFGFNHLEGLKEFEMLSEELIKKIKELGSEVILWSTYNTINTNISDQLQKASNIYSKLSKNLNCSFIDIYSEFSKFDLTRIFTYRYKWENIEWNLKPGDIDFLHCNEIGNQIIAQCILKQFFNLDLSLSDEFEDFGNMKKAALEKFQKQLKD